MQTNMHTCKQAYMHTHFSAHVTYVKIEIVNQDSEKLDDV